MQPPFRTNNDGILEGMDTLHDIARIDGWEVIEARLDDGTLSVKSTMKCPNCRSKK